MMMRESVTRLAAQLLKQLDARDVLYFGGLLAMAAGGALIYGPAGLVVFGAGCMWLSTRGMT